MSNPYNETSTYNFPPQQPQQPHYNAPQPGAWGQQPQPKKKLGTGWKVLIALVLVFTLLLVGAEFGMRAYMKNQIANGIKEQAAASGVTVTEEPEVSFGTSPVLLGLLGSKVPELNMTVPSSLKITYPDGDKSHPEVTGNPKLEIRGQDLNVGDGGKQMVFSDLTIGATIPTELMLAEASKASKNNQPSGGGGAADFLKDQLTITNVTPRPEKEVLEMEIAHGIATMEMKPTIKDGTMTFDVAGAQIFGFDVPEQFTNSIRDSLSKQTAQQMQGMEYRHVRVTSEGLFLELHGTNVDMQQLGQAVEHSSENNAGGSGAHGGGAGASLDGDSSRYPQGGPFGSSGDGYGMAA